MTETPTPARRYIDNDPKDVILRLPGIGNLMIIGKRHGATHERIGTVESVTEDNGLLRCGGVAHDSCIDPASITKIVIDTSSIMNEKVYPRIDFNGADGLPVFAVVGFGGLEPFEAGLEGLVMAADASIPARPPRPERAPVLPEDPALAPLNAALSSGAPITIAFEATGFSQRWTGVVPKVSPGMGFINVMTEDFHLHLLGSTVGRWHEERRGDGVLIRALDPEGRPTGLTLSSETAAAFSAHSTASEQLA
ncbi:hypothetical protein [Rhizobium sp. A37_96]